MSSVAFRTLNLTKKTGKNVRTTTDSVNVRNINSLRQIKKKKKPIFQFHRKFRWDAKKPDASLSPPYIHLVPSLFHSSSLLSRNLNSKVKCSMRADSNLASNQTLLCVIVKFSPYLYYCDFGGLGVFRRRTFRFGNFFPFYSSLVDCILSPVQFQIFVDVQNRIVWNVFVRQHFWKIIARHLHLQTFNALQVNLK